MSPLTWNGAQPPSWPPLGPLEKLRGGLRAGLAGVVTGVLVLGFLLARALSRLAGGRIAPQFAIAKLWSRLMLRLIGAQLVVRGTPMTHPGAVLANHSSWADILCLRAAATLHFVSKAEVRDWPGVGWIAAMCDTVFIERRRETLDAQRRMLQARMEAGQLLCIFPEGTSTDSLRVLRFKSSLFSALYEPGVIERAWAQPVTVNWLPPGDMPPESFGWWGEMEFGPHVWELLCRMRGARVELIFHPPIRIEGGPGRKALAQMAEETVRGAKSPQVA